jgi:hypothetical protein
MNDWVADIAEMHKKFGVNEAVRNMSPELLKKFIQFRLDFIQEELDESKNAKTADDLVDGLIDAIVVSLGTLDALDVDSHLAWDRVHSKNMLKDVGIKVGRPNPLGLPDLVKPVGWEPPSHTDNIGLLSKVFT